MPTEIVFAVYRPKAGNGPAVEAILRRHVPTLRRLGLATARPVVLVRSPTDGTYVEIFEWASNDAAQRAHHAPEVAALWGELGAVAEFAPLGALPDAARPFAHFQPVDGIVV